MARNFIITNGHIIDPANNISGKFDIVIREGKITTIEPFPTCAVGKDFLVIDASGLIVSPGFIDLHTHLREPGFEYKEDIESGSMAAVAGGFTSVFCMPNTNPVNDNRETTRYIMKRAGEVGILNIYPVGAISKNVSGVELSDMVGMSEEGVIAVSDDGSSVQNEELMRRGFELAKKLHLTVISHPEDMSLSGNGVINDGIVASELGLPGIPAEAENRIIERDIRLARETGSRLHIAHVSTAGGIDLVRDAKRRGNKITCEVTPHHLLLTEDAVIKYGPNAKMKPPLRTRDDMLDIIEAIKEGVVDAIATDHAPHAVDEKNNIMDASFGVIGMETALPVCMKFVEQNIITLERLIELFTAGPARVVGIDKGRLDIGSKADITIIDPNCEYTIDSTTFKSKSRNTPFNGWKVRGKVLYTIVNGNLKYGQK